MDKKVVAFAGGVGGAKLVYGLAQVIVPQNLTVVVNTGDDFEHLGLYIAPDVDTVMYTLAGLANPKTGWGLKDESWQMMSAMTAYGGPTWFNLGDRDLATHLLRTTWMREGYPYTWVTRELCRRLGVHHNLMPMSDSPVRTVFHTDEGDLAFQEYFVKKKWQPVVQGISFAGAETADLSRELVTTIREADVIIFCPSNPLISIDPILSLPNLRRILALARVPKIAISPIVGGEAVKGPAAKLMAELGLEASAVGVARHLLDVLNHFVVDHADEDHQDTLSDLGLRSLATNTIMTSNEDRVRLANEILAFA
ncbi:MAG: 2-phospho-L-lactate transferase [Okeania sp. SIO3B3]|nr:2-phospho-L-lactate transferase [Okeania sp. SIO3B3]